MKSKLDLLLLIIIVAVVNVPHLIPYLQHNRHLQHRNKGEFLEYHSE